MNLSDIEKEFDKTFISMGAFNTSAHKAFMRQTFTKLLESLKVEKKDLNCTHDISNCDHALTKKEEGFNSAIDQYESLKKELLK